MRGTWCVSVPIETCHIVLARSSHMDLARSSTETEKDIATSQTAISLLSSIPRNAIHTVSPHQTHVNGNNNELVCMKYPIDRRRLGVGELA
jgi:hypothetical protein